MAIQKKTPAAPPRAAAKVATPINRGKVAGTGSNGGGQAFASLNPEDFTQGGLLDDVDVTFVSCRFVEWDYDGKIDHPVLALLVEMAYDDNGKEAVAQQYYSAGELARFYPSEDGTHAVPVAGAKGLAGGTNAAVLLKSVIDQGFPVANFGDGDVSAMDGLVAHINRVAQPKRGGTISGKTQSGYEATVAVVTKIHQMPGEAAAPAPSNRPTSAGRSAKPAATRPSAPAAKAASNGDADVSEEAAGVLIEILNGKGGTVAKRGIPPAAFKPLSGNPNRSEILNLLADDEWLGEHGADYGWEFDGTTVTAAG